MSTGAVLDGVQENTLVILLNVAVSDALPVIS